MRGVSGANVGMGEGLTMEGHNVILKDNVLNGYKVLTDLIEEKYNDLSTVQLTELLRIQREAFAVIERRKTDRRAS